MRKKYEEQMIFAYLIPNNKLDKELEAISQVITENKDVLSLIHKDLTAYKDESTGRLGLNSNQVLRCAVLKQYQGLSYDELEFYLSDSSCFRAFARIGNNQYPKSSALQENIKAISSSTWERINQSFVKYSLKKTVLPQFVWVSLLIRLCSDTSSGRPDESR